MQILLSIMKIISHLLLTAFSLLPVLTFMYIMCDKDKQKDEDRSDKDDNEVPELILYTDPFESIQQGDVIYKFKTNTLLKLSTCLKSGGRILVANSYLSPEKYGWGKEYIKVSEGAYFTYGDIKVSLNEENIELLYPCIIEKMQKIRSEQALEEQSQFTIATILNHINYILEHDPEHLEEEVLKQSLLLDKLVQIIDTANEQALGEYRNKYNEVYSNLTSYWDNMLDVTTEKQEQLSNNKE